MKRKLDSPVLTWCLISAASWLCDPATARLHGWWWWWWFWRGPATAAYAAADFCAKRLRSWIGGTDAWNWCCREPRHNVLRRLPAAAPAAPAPACFRVWCWFRSTGPGSLLPTAIGLTRRQESFRFVPCKSTKGLERCGGGLVKRVLLCFCVVSLFKHCHGRDKLRPFCFLSLLCHFFFFFFSSSFFFLLYKNVSFSCSEL